MSQYKERYFEQKDSVLECIENANSFFEKYERKHEMEMLAIQKENLENGEFSISVVGEFSAGKSTFLNALMGERLLPSFSSETTATINFLRHKDQAESNEAGCVYYKNGKTEKIYSADLNTISQYVSTDSRVIRPAGYSEFSCLKVLLPELQRPFDSIHV